MDEYSFVKEKLNDGCIVPQAEGAPGPLVLLSSAATDATNQMSRIIITCTNARAKTRAAMARPENAGKSFEELRDENDTVDIVCLELSCPLCRYRGFEMSCHHRQHLIPPFKNPAAARETRALYSSEQARAQENLNAISSENRAVLRSDDVLRFFLRAPLITQQEVAHLRSFIMVVDPSGESQENSETAVAILAVVNLQYVLVGLGARYTSNPDMLRDLIVDCLEMVRTHWGGGGGERNNCDSEKIEVLLCCEDNTAYAGSIVAERVRAEYGPDSNLVVYQPVRRTSNEFVSDFIYGIHTGDNKVEYATNMEAALSALRIYEHLLVPQTDQIVDEVSLSIARKKGARSHEGGSISSDCVTPVDVWAYFASHGSMYKNINALVYRLLSGRSVDATDQEAMHAVAREEQTAAATAAASGDYSAAAAARGGAPMVSGGVIIPNDVLVREMLKAYRRHPTFSAQRLVVLGKLWDQSLRVSYRSTPKGKKTFGGKDNACQDDCFLAVSMVITCACKIGGTFFDSVPVEFRNRFLVQGGLMPIPVQLRPEGHQDAHAAFVAQGHIAAARATQGSNNFGARIYS